MSAGVQAVQDGTLIERAMTFLAARPADSATITNEVLAVRRAPPLVSERLASALLGADPRIRRLADGRWDLVRGGVRSPAIADCTFAVVDVETTGSRAGNGDGITEIAVVLVHQGTVEVVLDTLVNPERPIPSIVTALTRISASDVRDKAPFADIADEVMSALGGRVFVAHNMKFDWNFIAHAVRRARGVVLDGPRLCTVRLAKKLIPGLRSRSLDSVTNYFGVEITERHRAGGDALATAHVLRHLLERAAEAGAKTLQDLERMCARRPPKRRKRRTARSLPSTMDEA